MTNLAVPILVAGRALQPAGVTFARCNWGRWIADCASPHCTSALQLEYMQPSMTCRDCGWPTGHIVWPDDPAAITYVLSLRPDEKTRNAEPGETVDMLVAEKLGVAAPDVEYLPDQWYERALSALSAENWAERERAMRNRNR